MRILTWHALIRRLLKLLISGSSQYSKGADRQAHGPVVVTMPKVISWVLISSYILWGSPSNSATSEFRPAILF